MAGKEGETIINMSQAELKLIALGTRFMENGKVDYEMLAKHCGYTKGSAHVLYRKALRKLTDAYPIEGDASGSSGLDAGTDPVTPSKAKTPKTPKSRASGKKRKDTVAADGQDTTALTPIGGPLTPLAPGSDIVYGVGEIVMETPTKKPKKAVAKHASFTTLAADDGNDFFKDEPLFEPTIKSE